MIKSTPPLPGQRKADVTQESDEEELREQLDMHSIIVPCVEEEPLVTAEQVRCRSAALAAKARRAAW